MRSLYQSIIQGANIPITTAAITSSTSITDTSAALDTLGYSTGVIQGFTTKQAGSASPTTTISLLESATPGGTFTQALYNDGTAIQFSLTGNWSGGAVQRGGMPIEGLGLNRLRYFKVQIVSSSNGNSTPVGYGEICLGRAQIKPTQSTNLSKV